MKTQIKTKKALLDMLKKGQKQLNSSDIAATDKISSLINLIIGMLEDTGDIDISNLTILSKPNRSASFEGAYCFFSKDSFEKAIQNCESRLTSGKNTSDDILLGLYALKAEIFKLTSSASACSKFVLTVRQIRDWLERWKDDAANKEYNERIKNAIRSLNEEYTIANLESFQYICCNSDGSNTTIKELNEITDCDISLPQILFVLNVELRTLIKRLPAIGVIEEGVRRKASPITFVLSMAVSLLTLLSNLFALWYDKTPQDWLWVLSAVSFFGGILLSMFPPITRFAITRFVIWGLKRNSKNRLEYLRANKNVNRIIRGSKIKFNVSSTENKLERWLSGKASVSLFPKCSERDCKLFIRLEYGDKKSEIQVEDGKGISGIFGEESCLRLYWYYCDKIGEEFNGACDLNKNQVISALKEKIIDRAAKLGFSFADNGEQESAVKYLFTPYDKMKKKEDGTAYDYKFAKEIVDDISGSKVPFCPHAKIDTTDYFWEEDRFSTPIDFVFKYAIIDEDGNNARNHFLIYPECVHDERGNFKWSVKLVVLDWNLAAISDEKFRVLMLNGSGESLPVEILKKYPLAQFDMIVCNAGDNVDHVSQKLYSGEEQSTVSAQNQSVNKYNFGKDKVGGKGNYCSLNLCNDFFAEVKSGAFSGEITLKKNSSTTESRKFSFSINFYPKKVVRSKDSERSDKERLYVDKNKMTEKSLRAAPLYKAKCPFCGEPLTGKEPKEMKGESYLLCNNNHSVCYYCVKFKEDGKKTVETTAKDEKTKGWELHVDPNTRQSCLVSLVGGSQSGKSTFISCLFGEQFDCSYLNGALKPYVRCVKPAMITANKLDELNLSREVYKLKYGMKKYGEFVKKTDPDDVPSLSHTPFTINLMGLQNYDENASISFFDLPGGAFDKFAEGTSLILNEKEEVKIASTMLVKSDCFIVLIDGNSRTEEEGVGGNIENACAYLKNILKEYEQDKDNKNMKRKPIIAFVFTQFDKFVHNFSDTSYVRMTPPISKAAKFRGSQRDKYINACSKEVEEYLKRAEVNRLIEEVKNQVAAYKFFTVSSIGRRDAIIGEGGDTRTIYSTQPNNIENVLIWLMYQSNIIK